MWLSFFSAKYREFFDSGLRSALNSLEEHCKILIIYHIVKKTNVNDK